MRNESLGASRAFDPIEIDSSEFVRCDCGAALRTCDVEGLLYFAEVDSLVVGSH